MAKQYTQMGAAPESARDRMGPTQFLGGEDMSGPWRAPIAMIGVSIIAIKVLANPGGAAARARDGQSEFLPFGKPPGRRLPSLA